MMELRPGVALDKHFGSLSDDQKHSVVDQIADTFACIRDAVLINKVNSYGGLTINNGTIVNGQMTTLKGGLWPTYAGFLRAKFTAQFEDADGSPVLGGWRDNGVRKRIDDFLTSGLDTFMPKAGIDTTKRVLLHGDPTMNNILFDQETNKITGLVDFDFASVRHPCQEVFTSFHDLGGNVFSEETVEGRMFEEALAGRRIDRPSTIPGMDTLKQLGKLEGLLSYAACQEDSGPEYK